MQSDRARRQHVLETARTEVNRQRPVAAEELLKSARHEFDESDPLDYAEYLLILGEAYAARLDPEAESFFEDALGRLKTMESCPPSLRVRAAEHFGDFLTTSRRVSAARRYYEIARRLALESRLSEHSARLQLKLLRIDLELDHDPQLENFQTFKRVSDRLGATPAQQLAAWTLHTGSLQAMGKGLRYARNKNIATEAYFQNLLQSVRQS